MRLKSARRTAWAVLTLSAAANVFGQPEMMPSNMTQRIGIGSPAGFNQQAITGARSMGIGNYGFMPGQTLPANTVLPSDNSIDENEYVVGAGDVFFITAVESQSIRYTAAIDQSGKAYIQNVGVIDIGKVSYAEAKKKISESISSMLKNPSEIYVTLIQTKNAVVSITGQVQFPGSYDLPGITRVFDAVLTANNGELPHAANADLRQTRLIRGDTTIVCDLLAFLHGDDQTQNPYIYPGDRIRINTTAAKVFISGSVKSPPSGHYPIKDGETVREFLSMFTFDNVADRENILIYKTVDNAKMTLTEADLDLVLNDLDAITVPVKKNFPGIHTASIAGEVASPGQYPIIENTTTARQLIDMAGGMKETGFADQAVVIRQMRNLPDHFNAAAPPYLTTVRPEYGSAVGTASASLDYTVIRLILYNADKIILEPEDQIYIPKKDKYVYLSGAVKNPGAYPFAMGKDSDYYVKQAGGYTRNADKANTQVFLKYGSVVQSVQPLCIEPGSVIVTPTSVQYKFMSQVILPWISALATTVGVGLAIFNIAR